MTELQDIDFVELSDEEMHLYSRQILLDGWDIEAQEKLKLANALIVGAGGIGCTSAELLARAGVGKITLIDADTIEISNLQRQIAFGHEDIGRYKAEILAKRLQKINPYICVEYYNERLDEHNIDRLIEHQDVVLDGCDNFTTRYLVNAACKKHQVALISASAIGFQAQMFMVEGDSACYECLFPKEQHSNEGLRCAESGGTCNHPCNDSVITITSHFAVFRFKSCTFKAETIIVGWFKYDTTYC